MNGYLVNVACNKGIAVPLYSTYKAALNHVQGKYIIARNMGQLSDTLCQRKIYFLLQKEISALKNTTLQKCFKYIYEPYFEYH